jgi:hypothetical protein
MERWASVSWMIMIVSPHQEQDAPTR